MRAALLGGAVEIVAMLDQASPRLRALAGAEGIEQGVRAIAGHF
jgi:hypothetical protein